MGEGGVGVNSGLQASRSLLLLESVGLLGLLFVFFLSSCSYLGPCGSSNIKILKTSYT